MTFEVKDCFNSSLIRQHGAFSHFDVVEAGAPGAIVFCELEEHVRRARLNPNVAAIVTTTIAAADIELPSSLGLVIVKQPRLSYWQLFNRLAEEGRLKPEMEFGIGAGCRIHPSAVISDKVWIGDGVVIEAAATIADYSIVGDDCLIGTGARIGAEGLQSVVDGERKLFVRHVGGARLGQRVAVLANAVVSRGVHPVFTTVGDDTHVSLLSSIGHQSRIGRRCSIAGNCLIGGSVTMGDDVALGPSVTIRDGLTIGAGARLRIGSVVIEDVREGADLSGNFAYRHTSNVRRYVEVARDRD